MALSEFSMFFKYLFFTKSEALSDFSMVYEYHYEYILVYFLSTFCFQSPVNILSIFYFVSPVIFKFIYFSMFSIFSKIFLYSKSSILSKFLYVQYFLWYFISIVLGLLVVKVFMDNALVWVYTTYHILAPIPGKDISG